MEISRAVNYVSSNVFDVNICGIELSFSKVSGIGDSVEYDTYTEGGGIVHILPKPKSSAGTVTFERGISVVDKGFIGFLTNGCEVGDISVNLKKNGKIAESYYIGSGIVISWEISELDGLAASVAVNKFTVAHTGIRRM